jgi:hypothetical protein
MASRPATMMPSLSPHARALAVLATLALAATAAAPAAAASPPRATFALTPVGKPGAMLLRGVPGRVIRGAVSVRNVSRHRITVILEPADIRTASNGNADYVTTPLSLAGRWLHLAAKTVRLSPNAVRQVAFTLSIPAGTRGASHYAGVVAVDAAEVAAATRKVPASRSFSFNFVTRQALPMTVRTPGPLLRALSLRSLGITVEPAGAGLVLGLRAGGSDLIGSTRVDLRVLRGSRTVLRDASTLGQLFPDTGLDFRIPWVGVPTKGTYRVVGVIRPTGAAPIYINQTIGFSPAKVTQLSRETAPGAATARATPSSMPFWAWAALVIAGALVALLLLIVWKLRRRPAEQVA